MMFFENFKINESRTSSSMGTLTIKDTMLNDGPDILENGISTTELKELFGERYEEFFGEGEGVLTLARADMQVGYECEYNSDEPNSCEMSEDPEMVEYKWEDGFDDFESLSDEERNEKKELILKFDKAVSSYMEALAMDSDDWDIDANDGY